MGDRSRPQDGLEQRVQERNVSWYAVWNCFAQLSETGCITGQGKERLHKHVWAQRHYRIDVTTSTVERKTGGLASAGACPGGCKDFSHSPRSAPPPPPAPPHQDHKGISWRLRHFINYFFKNHNIFLTKLYEHNLLCFFERVCFVTQETKVEGPHGFKSF